MQKVFAEVSDTIGFDSALRLVRRWGGTSLSVPVKIDAQHPIAEAIGLEDAAKLVQAHSGKDLQLPTERSALRDMRDAKIHHECTVNRRSHSAVCGEYGLTRQAIAAILRRVEARSECAA